MDSEGVFDSTSEPLINLTEELYELVTLNSIFDTLLYFKHIQQAALVKI